LNPKTVTTRYYLSDAGSRVEVDAGGVNIDWDWCEEDGCCDAHPVWDRDEQAIIAACECCEEPTVVECREVTREEWEQTC
jgi:hypothetical protein